MKIAVTYDEDSEEVLQHFGRTPAFRIYDVQDKKAKKGLYISKNKNPAILLFDMYAFEIMLYVFAVIIGVINQPQGQAVSMIAFLLTVPFFFYRQASSNDL